MNVNLVAVLVSLLTSLISVYQLNCLLLFLNATVYPGFHTGGGGGGGVAALGSPPPPRIPKVVTVLLINKYIIVGIATGQTILNLQ